MITTVDGDIMTLELEDHDAFQTYRAGIEDRRQWQRHPETKEMADTISSNNRTSKIFVKHGDFNRRVR